MGLDILPDVISNSSSFSKPIRILCLGGSVMFGLGATSDDYTIPSIVNKYLQSNPKLSGKNITITNMAMLGYTSSQELLLLKAYIDSYDLVVVLDGWNELDQYHPSGLPASSYHYLSRSLSSSSYSIRSIFLASYFLKLVKTLSAQLLVSLTRFNIASRTYPTNYSLY